MEEGVPQLSDKRWQWGSGLSTKSDVTTWKKKKKKNRKFLNYSNRLHAKKRPCSANLWGKFLSEIFTSYRKGGLVKKWWFLGLVKKWWFWAYVLFESWPDKILQFRLWSTWDDLAYCRQNWPKQTSRFKRAASPTQ